MAVNEIFLDSRDVKLTS